MKKFFVLFFVLSFCFLWLSGCVAEDEMAKTLQSESKVIATRQQKLAETQPVPEIGFSNARDIISRKTVTFNEPNKISYIYLISKAGTILGFYTVKGYVVDLSCYMVPDDQIVDDPFDNTGSGGLVIQSADADGTYGTNGEGKYFFTTDGTYVEFNCEYILCDKPLSISQPPILTMNIPDKVKK
jgi:hypothetical protein